MSSQAGIPASERKLETKPYRVKYPRPNEPQGKHYVGKINDDTGLVDPEDAFAKPGDIVQLTRQQYEAFKDRFEEIVTLEASDVAKPPSPGPKPPPGPPPKPPGAAE